jgi:hypothetical protein
VNLAAVALTALMTAFAAAAFGLAQRGRKF